MGREVRHQQGRPGRQERPCGQHVFEWPAESVQRNGHGVGAAFRNPDAEFDVHSRRGPQAALDVDIESFRRGIGGQGHGAKVTHAAWT